MGTRGAFGVVIGEKEKIGYNQFDSYPDGCGVDNLRWLREEWERDQHQTIRRLAENARVADNSTPPTADEVKACAEYTNTNVHDQTTADWYCLTRESHGHIGAMLECGYIYDSHTFPLDSLFCEWAYIVDFDKNVFEVYEGFQKVVPTMGRWAGRPTPDEDDANYEEHLVQCAENDREPWMPRISEYKAVELVASWPLDALPTEGEFKQKFDHEEVVV